MTPAERAKQILDLAADMELAQGEGKVDKAFLTSTLRWIKRNYAQDVVAEAERIIAAGYKGK